MKRALATLILASLLISTFPLGVSAGATDDIPTNASATGEHGILVDALTQAGLVSTLQGSGPFTVFAPTDQAFIDAGIDLSTFDTDAENATLVDILTYHVVSGKVMSTDLSDRLVVDALNTDKLSFAVSTNNVMVNDAVVTGADVESSNGVIHVIDKVLMPPVDIFVGDGSMTAPYYQFYSDAAGSNEVTEIDTTKNYNFQRLNNPSTHPFYISDVGYGAASSTDIIITGDGSATTGISDGESFTLFFTPDFDVEQDTLTYYCSVHSTMVADFAIAPILSDIPATAAGTGNHASLVAALTQANLVTTLQGTGPFTVFAPTDQAFTDAGIDLASFDTDAENATLVDILTYHVVSGSVASTALSDGLTATALNGDDVTFTVNAAGVQVNDANVVTADVATTNGIIHVIDKVLMPPADLVDIPTVATGTGNHTSLVAALTQANLVGTLQGTGPFTVFAPTDAAFTAAGIDLSSFDTDAENATLVDILTYHVVSGSVASTALSDGQTATALNGDDVTFTVNAAGVQVNDANVVTADVAASNGIIHVIDKVLMPPADLVDIPTVATGTGNHTSLVAALAQANLVATLQGTGPFTVFAPTDAAFTAAGIDLSSFDTDAENATLVDILTYHVVSGSVASTALTDGLTATALNGDVVTFTVNAAGVQVNDANVVTADVAASNGIIHVIDKVLMPPADLVDIPTVATGTGNHASLVAALAQANLVATLQGTGPFTVFAPTDAAFAAAGIDLATFDTDAENATLVDILTYHVVSGSVASTALSDGQTATALNGDDVTFTVNAAGVQVNDANVVTADVAASNGIIHVIDKVLMPPADQVTEPVQPACDATVRIAPSGLKFSPSELTITVGQTVCWQWENESMAHNVRQVDGDKSTTYAANGVSSGAAATTVDFRYTFDVDSTTFYYACEPHLAAGMFGKVIVGDGGVVEVTPPTADDSTDDSDEAVPGFLAIFATIALGGAAFVVSRRYD